MALRLPLKWIPADSFGGLFKRPAPAFVVVHCTESDNTPAIAESLAGPNWFGVGGPATTSTHKIVDVDSICEGVKRDRVAYHAGAGGNSWGIAYEFCGRASWSAAKWREPAQLRMLRNAAPHIADDLVAITGSRSAARAAARWLSVAQVAANAHGLCTHNDIRLAKGGTTHTDPGRNFPYAELLSYVLEELADAPAPAPAPALAHPVIGRIRECFDRVGGLALLGQPVGPEVPTANPKGRWQQFERGRILWHPDADEGRAHELHGEIERRFVAAGSEAVCGWPITDELPCPDLIGRYNHFTGDQSIYWSPPGGAQRVRGGIRVAWAAQGWETSKGIGYPVDEEHPAEGGLVQNFRRGSILWRDHKPTVRRA